MKYINVFDLEKVLQASMSGTNLATGGLLTLSMKGVGTSTSNRPTRAYVNCHYDAVAEITNSIPSGSRAIENEQKNYKQNQIP